jgi:AcrR family transcriptional regulator
MKAPEPEETDGRRLRSRDSRARIVAAMLALTREGAIPPSAEQVADRAGVGLRTVFRHFQDMESLYREMAGPIAGELRARAQRPFTATTWQERVLELIPRRGAAFEAVAPFRRSSDALRHNSAVLQAEHAALTRALRSILRDLIPKGAVDAPTFEALELMLSYEAWTRLRREQALAPSATRRTLDTAVRALLGMPREQESKRREGSRAGRVRRVRR